MFRKEEIPIITGIVILLSFTPIFGSVTKLYYVLMELIIFALVLYSFFLILLDFDPYHNKYKNEKYSFPYLPFKWIFLTFLSLIIFQLIKFPFSFIELISPKAAEIYNKVILFFDLNKGTWIPISVHTYGTMVAFLKIIAYGFTFYLACNFFRGRRRLKFILWVIVLLGTIQALYGLLEYFSGHQYILWEKKHYGLDCATGTFVNRNHFSGYLEMILPIALAFFYSKLHSNFKDILIKDIIRDHELSEHFFKISISFFFMILMGLAIFFSYSRSGVITIFLTFILFFLIGLGLKRSSWLILIFIGLLVLWGAQIGLKTLIERFIAIGDEITANGSRLTQWKDTVKMIKDFILFGSGLGTYKDVFPIYQSFAPRIQFDHAHNDILQFLAETGIVGFSILSYGAIKIITSLYKIWKKRTGLPSWTALGSLISFIVVIFHSLTDFNMQIPSNAFLLSFILGIGIGQKKVDKRY